MPLLAAPAGKVNPRYCIYWDRGIRMFNRRLCVAVLFIQRAVKPLALAIGI